jgi:NAD(P)-dependent dehydrogenase (short-subunit alcohol dehydrogenase family)
MTTVATGGGSGLGRQLCRQAASRGARVIVWDLDGEAAAQTVELITAAGGAACHQQVDVTDAAAVSRQLRGQGRWTSW